MPGLLEIRDLAVEYATGGGPPAGAVRAVSLDVDAGEAVGLLGESGCGKTTLLLAVLGLLPSAARVVGGSIRFRGRELLGLAASELRRVRGAEIAIVFQEPALALNPVRRVGAQVADVAQAHGERSTRRARAQAVAMLAEVGFTEPARIAQAYPHELSGGQRQRVAIAQALVCRPALLLADEPTASLDAIAQAELRALLGALQQRLDLAVLMASHDLGSLAAVARRLVVMYAGRIVEEGTPSEVLGEPLHPYTRGLSRAYPRPADTADARRATLDPIPGAPPDLAAPPSGCAFEPRCAQRRSVCVERVPAVVAMAGRRVRCVLHG